MHSKISTLVIPSLIDSGKYHNFLRKSFLILLILALMLHIGFFATLSYLDKNPLSLLFITKPETIKPEDTLNFVIVDDKLVNEEVTEETPTVLGRVSRQSRDTVIDPDLPKTGPSSSDESSVTAFDLGSPLPESIATPEISPSPPPVPQVLPKEPSKPIVTRVEIPEPVKTQPPEERIAPALPELDLQEDLKSMLPKPEATKATEKPDEIKKPDTESVPGITSSDAISKITRKPDTPETNPAPKPAEQQKPQRRVPTRKIPVRKISSSNSSSGGKLRKKLNTSAINAGSKSIAVLRSRYGEYMDLILRRIQQAIIIQQQINPIGIHEGSVVMSFTINPQGVLDDIQFIGAAPQGITTEVSIARSVLHDVQNGKPFSPPSQQMLNDPEFQRIVINFVFENL